MIHRIIHEDWLLIFPIVAFFVAAMVGAVAARRTAAMKPVKVGRLVQPPPDPE